MSQIVKLRRSSVSGQKPTNSNLQLGELALNTTDGKVYMAVSGSLGPSVEELVSTNTVNTGSIHLVGSITASSFSGSAIGLSDVPFRITGSDVDGNQNDKTFTKLHFDSDTGLNVSESAPGTAFISIGSHFKDIFVYGQPLLSATGSDAFEVIGEDGIGISTSITDTNGNGYIKELKINATSLSSSLNNRMDTITGSITTLSSSLTTTINNVSNSVDSLNTFTSSVVLTSQTSSMTVLSASYALTAAFALNAGAGGGGGSAIGSYSSLTQTIPATTWSFTHNIGQQYPIFQVFDNDGFVVIPSQIRAIDENTAEIIFPSAQSGIVVASLGGGNGATEEFSNSALWTVNHNLGTDYPDVTVWDSNKNIILPNRVESVSSNQIKIYFSAPVSGHVSVSRGGHILSGSATWDTLSGKPSGLVSGSSQLTPTFDTRYVLSGSITQTTWDNIANKPVGIVSGSSQVLNGSGVWSGSAQLPTGVVSGSSQILNGSGLWSGSGQLPSGVVSGSSQVLAGTTIHSGTFFNGISVVSGSGQVTAFGFATTGSNTFIGTENINGNLNVTGSIVVSSGSAVYNSSLNLTDTSSLTLNSGSSLYVYDTGIISGTFKGNVSGSLPINGNVSITGSIIANNISASNFTGSFKGDGVGLYNIPITGITNLLTVSGSLDSRLDVLEAYSGSQLVPSSSMSFRTLQTDVYCKNSTGTQINKGTVVRIVGAVGDNPLISVASLLTEGQSANTLGIATENIPNDTFGLVITEGVLVGVNTSGMTAGQLVYLGANGTFTTTPPVAPNHGVRLGEVLREQQQQGSIYVRIDNGSELGEAHDVVDTTTNSSYGDLLVKSGSVWINSRSLNGDYAVTGSLTITQNLTVLGSSSLVYVTSSQLIVSSSTISVNVFEPAERFGGLKVYDSGSSSATASLLWDSLHNHWVYQNVSGSNYSGGMLIAGPRNTGSLGDEPTLTSGRIVKSVGGDHIDNSIISETGTTITIAGDLVANSITGAFDFYGLINRPTLVSGSSQISYNGLTDIPSGIISSSIQLPSGIVSGSSQILDNSGIWSGSAQLPGGIVSGSSQILDGSGIWSGSAQLPSDVVSGSSQIIYSGLTGIPSGIVSGSSQILDGSGIWSGSSQLPSGIISGSDQLPSGVVSGSSQILLGSGIWSGSAQLPSGIVSGSEQLTGSYDTRYVLSGSITQTTWDNIANKPSDIISGSSQIINLGFATTGSNNFIGTETVTGSLLVSGSVVISGSLDLSNANIGSSRYLFTQGTTLATWSISHNLGYNYPNVTVYDGATNKIMLPADVISVDANTTQITFATPEYGYALVSVGGISTSSADRYLHTQTSATGSWVIDHNIGYKYVTVNIYDGNDEQLIPQKITAVSVNRTQIDFVAPTSGNAIITVGGPRSTSIFTQTGSYYNTNYNIGITGSLVVTGDVDAANFNTTSDRKLKTNLVRIEGALDKIEKLNGYTFDWLEEYSEDRTRQIGMLADEVYEVQPELISHRDIVLSNKEEKIKLLDYSKVTAILIEAIKELNDKVTKLENKRKKK